ncbi:MAG TPA: DEAD/DEAH box helicase family protein [Chthonomonadaceae bacterium]|nr:DEAD/DEAH box helicase family protein [Chthonomonadaceae bacterium]
MSGGAFSGYNADALRPLFLPWEQPDRHRTPNPLHGGQALIEPGRRNSKCLLVPRLRFEVEMWRHNGYAGASETSRTLLNHWFETAHESGFRYHFCQREAIETIIWLYEVAQYRSLSSMLANLLDDSRPDYLTLLNGVSDADDAWARYCSKIATGGGKTKVMSLVVVWSYFHRLFEPGSDLSQHFLIVAPNLIVFERLKDDFQNRAIFDRDPLLPPEWKDSFDLQVILQDDAGGGASAGALYLTNIHRLFERDRATNAAAGPAWAGPQVYRATALKVGEALRRRIAEHPSVMVLNDEAHHLHDPDSAWNEALTTLDKQSRERGNAGIRAQLDFTATPKHNDGSLFRHVICDFPLGEAVDAGIVKVPVIGRSEELRPRTAESAADRYRVHLRLGYEQYVHAYQEWSATRKPILFVMTEDTQAADELTTALDSDDYPLLKGRVVNLHTRLKGRIKRFKNGRAEFEVNEKQMSDEDLMVVRQISRDLDALDSPYRCVVSVLMLREGWDVRNVTTIIPLRPYKAESNILAEQTLGRGLRRMTPPGPDAAPERVTVVEHAAFVKLYEEELAEEGVVIDSVTIGGGTPKPVSVSIFPDSKKPIAALDISIPVVSDSIQTTATLDGLTFEEIRDYFAKFERLPIEKKRSGDLVFEERALFTEELIASWKIDRGLLAIGATAIGAFVRELERACRLQSANAVLAPLLKRFIEEVLFERPVSLYDGSVDHRMGDTDVAEHIRATFAPLIRKRTVAKSERVRSTDAVPISTWKPYQASSTPIRPCVPAERTLFNLVPCNQDLETQFADFCDHAEDVTAFAKNAGPQKLMIDYLAPNGRPALYVPDFLVRAADGVHYLVETKGQQDAAVPAKAQAAVAWCASASSKETPWKYLFIPMSVFDANTEFSIEALARACAPRLKGLMEQGKTGQGELPLEMTPQEVKEERTDRALQAAGAVGLPDEIVQYVTQAVNLLDYDRKKNHPQLGSAFQPLLYPIEKLSGELLLKLLRSHVPAGPQDRTYYFEPYLGDQPKSVQAPFEKNQRFLRKFLVHGDKMNLIGTLLFCLEYPVKWSKNFGGIWQDVKTEFSAPPVAGIHNALDSVNRFRGKYVAHQDEALTDGAVAETVMLEWIATIRELYLLVT